MEIIAKVKEVLEPRSFDSKKRDGSPDKVHVQGLIVESAGDELFVEGYTDVCEKAKKDHLEAGDVISLRLSGGVKKREKDGQTYISTSFLVIGYDRLFQKNPTF